MSPSDSGWHVTIVYPGQGGAIDGIRDHSSRLAEGLRCCGAEVSVHFRNEALRAVVRLVQQPRSRATRHALIVQYNPLSYGRSGFAPSWPIHLWRLRLSADPPLIAVVVHELETPLAPPNARRRVADPWRQIQAGSVHAAADVLLTPVERYAARLRQRNPRRRVAHLPVGSNLRYQATDRDRKRLRTKLSVNGLVLGTFALGHNHLRLQGAVARAANAAAREIDEPVTLLCVGAGAHVPSGLDPKIRVVAPGVLEEHELPSYLVATDIFLIALADGVSARRTSLMAALQQGLPIVGTRGAWTDSVLQSQADAMVLVPAGDDEGFAQAVVSLAHDPERRIAMGRAGRALYTSRFAWGKICTDLLTQLESARLSRDR